MLLLLQLVALPTTATSRGSWVLLLVSRGMGRWQEVVVLVLAACNVESAVSCTCYAARSRGDRRSQRKVIMPATSWYKLSSGAATSKAKTKTSKPKISK